MLSFYKLDMTSILVMFVSAFIIYNIIDKVTHKEDSKNENHLMNGVISIVLGFMISVCVSKATIEGDPVSTDGFWDNK